MSPDTRKRSVAKRAQGGGPERLDARAARAHLVKARAQASRYGAVVSSRTREATQRTAGSVRKRPVTWSLAVLGVVGLVASFFMRDRLAGPGRAMAGQFRGLARRGGFG
jgi:ElaB/YqjD/DUF883 family membrane-anchored ribosome-binding protein